MPMRKYNILWFDDDHEDHIEFKMMAKKANIIITAFKSAEGINYLEKNLNLFDAVILDAMFYTEEKNTNQVPGLKAFSMVRDRLKQLEVRKKLPIFILSGQTRFDQDTTFRESFGEHYRKTNPADINKLFADIKTNVNLLPDAELKQKYASVFELCEDKYIGQDNFDRLLILVKHIENKELTHLAEDMLNPIRKIIEAILIRLHQLNMIPSEIINNSGWINGASKFLDQKQQGFVHIKPFFPKLMAENLRHILALTQDGSHAFGNLNFQVEKYIRSANSDFLYRSIVLLLFDLLISFKAFFDQYPDANQNKLLWSPKPDDDLNNKNSENTDHWMPGTVSHIQPNGFGTFKPDNNAQNTIGILPEHVELYNIKQYDRLEITTKPNHDGTKTYIQQIKKI